MLIYLQYAMTEETWLSDAPLRQIASMMQQA